jgi:hypothetical protein
VRWSRRGAGDDPKATVALCRINDPFPVDAHGDEHEHLLPPRHEPFGGVAQDLVLFSFARPDDHLGPPAGQPSTPTGTTAGGAFRGRISREPIIAPARPVRPTDRTSASAEPLLATTRPRGAAGNPSTAAARALRG